MEDISKRVRPTLLSMVPYAPGKPISEVQREYELETIVKLASNENPLGASELVKERIVQALTELHRYPDGTQYDLKQAIASYLQVTPNSLLIGNGSDEIIKLLCETFVQPGDQVLFPSPSFSEYEFGAKLMEAQLSAIPLSSDFEYELHQFREAITDKTKMIFLCSPNNPTGTYLPFTDLKKFVSELPSGIVVVVDEAYIEYVEAEDFKSSISLIEEGYNVVCMRTFSKAFGLASLRVGYCVAKPELIEYVNLTREPFNVNHLAQVAAIAALEDTAHTVRSVSLNRDERKRLVHELTRLGMKVVPSQTNFILFDTGRESKPLFESLLKKGVIVRVFGGLPTYIRLSIGSESENTTFLKAFMEVLERE